MSVAPSVVPMPVTVSAAQERRPGWAMTTRWAWSVAGPGGELLDLPAGVGEEGNRTGEHLEALLELGDDGRCIGHHLRERAGQRRRNGDDGDSEQQDQQDRADRRRHAAPAEIADQRAEGYGDEDGEQDGKKEPAGVVDGPGRTMTKVPDHRERDDARNARRTSPPRNPTIGAAFIELAMFGSSAGG